MTLWLYNLFHKTEVPVHKFCYSLNLQKILHKRYLSTETKQPPKSYIFRTGHHLNKHTPHSETYSHQLGMRAIRHSILQYRIIVFRSILVIYLPTLARLPDDRASDTLWVRTSAEFDQQLTYETGSRSFPARRSFIWDSVWEGKGRRRLDNLTAPSQLLCPTTGTA